VTDALAPPPSIYAPRETPRADAGTNTGGVHLGVTTAYRTDYIYRGIDISEGLTTFTDPLALVAPGDTGPEDAPNLQFDATLSFDLGKAPHPFVGVFVNIFEADPVSRFQEVRPYFGFDWYLKPLTLTAGVNTYIFPEREPLNTAEVFARVQLDDSILWKTDRGVFNPYVLGAFDYDLYKGSYIEFGVSHDVPIPDTGLTLTFYSDLAYVTSHEFFAPTPGGDGEDSGFQHYDVGLLVRFDFNDAFALGGRYGHWAVEGQLTYTDGIDEDLRATEQLWGGVALKFGY
jgi:hypothetical protein